ncbi:MAG: hypothetical protein IJ733_01930 [Lachnospiraceae bacterium]|nr:hypothetical protein [Lachnospiraceae bacterium]
METAMHYTNRPITEVIESMQKTFIAKNGKLLTEEEVVILVDEIRAELKKTGEIVNEN